MILAFDTYYYTNKAKTVCIAFEHWTESADYKVYTKTTENITEYTPGEFYKRELPCILNLLKKIDTANIEAIIIDGYVHLDDDNKPGLGVHLYNSLTQQIPVIGVAKTNFATIHKNKRELLRGNSARPLYITAIGIDVDHAAKLIASMHGENRMPALLKIADTLTKENIPGQ